MFRTRPIDSNVRSELQTYDAILMQLCEPHPRLTATQEANLKGWLLKVIDDCLSQNDPRKLMRQFQEAMVTV